MALNLRRSCLPRVSVAPAVLCIILAGNVFAALEKEPIDCGTRPCTYKITCASEVCTANEVNQVQQAIDDAQLGDTIQLQAGRVFPVTSSPYGLQLKHKNSGSGYITITTTEFTRLPDADTRITPEYAALLPTIRADAQPMPAITTENGYVTGPAEYYKLIGLRFTNHPGRDFSRGFIQIGSPTGIKARVVAKPETKELVLDSGRYIDPGSYVVLSTTGTLPKGLSTNTKYYITTGSNNSAIRLSEKVGGQPINIEDAGTGEHTVFEQGITSPDLQAGNIIIDRCIVTGTFDRQIRAGIALHGRYVTVKNSFIERIQALGVDTQGIIGHNGTGPFTIENNYIDGVTENIMFGGARGLSPDNPPADDRGITPADISIRYNYLPKVPERYRWEAWEPGMYVELGKLVFSPNVRARGYIALNAGVTATTEPDWPTDASGTVQDGEVKWKPYSTNGSHWVVKNNFELKKGERLLFEHNVIDKMWRDGQESAINIKSQNEPFACSPDKDPTCYLGRTENIMIRNNIVRSAPTAIKYSQQGITGTNWVLLNNLFTDIDSKAWGTGGEWQAAVTGIPPIGMVIDHNTIIAPHTAGGIAFDTSRSYEDHPISLRNNIWSRGNTGVKGSGRAEGKATLETFLCVGGPCGSDLIDQNIIVGADRRVYPNATYNACAKDSACAPSYEYVGFRDPDNEDYSLRDDSAYRGLATDGKDIGVDMTQLAQIRNLKVTPAPKQVAFSYELSEPVKHIPCVLEVSDKRDLSQSINDLNPAFFTRSDSDSSRDAANKGSESRQFIVGADTSESGADGAQHNRSLSPGTTYYYRLMCGGDARRGSFTTSSE